MLHNESITILILNKKNMKRNFKCLESGCGALLGLEAKPDLIALGLTAKSDPISLGLFSWVCHHIKNNTKISKKY